MKVVLNKVTDKIEMFLQSTSVAFGIASVANPACGLVAPLINLAALPFHSYNSSLLEKQFSIIADEFNKLETKVSKLEQLSDNQKNTFLLNGYKFFDIVLKEKMKEKISIYAKILSEGINTGNIIEQNDFFDIQMDIINSLRHEDIALCNFIINFLSDKTDSPLTYQFTQSDLNDYIVATTDQEQVLNKYALRHLINLGLVDEEFLTDVQYEDESLNINKSIITKYNLTQRFRMIYQTIMS